MRARRFEWDRRGARALAAELRAMAPAADDLTEPVAEAIRAVREGGDAAVADLTERFDGCRPGALRVPATEVEAALAALDPPVREALEVAVRNVRAVAEAQASREGAGTTLPEGHMVTSRELPVGAAGAYVPGGRAPYPSSAVMCCVPAVVAGVGRIAVASPPGPDGHVAAVTLAACALAGATEVYAMGGVQAVAALAFGTATVEPVEVIVGPGSARVQEAKLQVSRRVGIDGYAGPSELMVILDGSADPDTVALDLCAQAEHGPESLLVAAGTGSAPLDAVVERTEALAADRPTVSAAAFGVVAAPDRDSVVALADALAPEHLELVCEDAAAVAGDVRTPGCVFTGPDAGAALGDYAAGSNHVLPTGGAGRFAGPLSPSAFQRSLPVVEVPHSAAEALAPYVDALARAEGFPVHGESVRARIGEKETRR